MSALDYFRLRSAKPAYICGSPFPWYPGILEQGQKQGQGVGFRVVSFWDLFSERRSGEYQMQHSQFTSTGNGPSEAAVEGTRPN